MCHAYLAMARLSFAKHYFFYKKLTTTTDYNWIERFKGNFRSLFAIVSELTAHAVCVMSTQNGKLKTTGN